MTQNNKTPNKTPNKNTKTSKPEEVSIADSLKKLGNLSKKTDKSQQTKLTRQTSKPKSVKSPVALIGGLQDTGRYQLVCAVMAIGFLALFYRAFDVQIRNVKFHRDKTENLILSTQPLLVRRGMILDTNGIPLAGNAPLVTVIFDAHAYAEAYYSIQKGITTTDSDVRRARLQEDLAKMDLARLAEVSNMPKETLTKLVNIDNNVDLLDKEAVQKALPTGKNSRRLVLLDKAPPEVADKILSLGFKGITSEHTEKRYYLQPEPNAHILGFMKTKQAEDSKKMILVGASGIESGYQKQLAGEEGKMLSIQTGSRKGSAIKAVKETMPKVDGQNISLTIDSRLQYILYNELVEMSKFQSARSSSGIVIDVKTGDVLAMASWPSYNNNDLGLRNEANERNRVIMDVVEPGSVVKPLTVAAALESKKFTVNSVIATSPGTYNLAGHTIKDGANYGNITLGKLIQKSSNIGSVKIAMSLPNNAIADMQKKFGFGQATNMGLPAEASGSLKPPENTARRGTLAYGYGQQVTLAQIAQAYGALGNGGVLMPLRIIKDMPTQPRQVVSAQTAKSVLAMMQTVTEEGGTGQLAAIDGYHVAGKTGTSRRKVVTYRTDQYRNVFAGIAPVSDPRFAVVILVEDPKKGKTAGQTVAPVFANVMKETLRLYNVPFDKPLTQTQPTSNEKQQRN